MEQMTRRKTHHNLIKHLDLEDTQKSIIGFSQGGYASPYITENLKNVKHVVGMGCRFKSFPNIEHAPNPDIINTTTKWVTEKL